MQKAHDRGGWPTDGPIDRTEHNIEDWERRTDAIVQVLVKKRIMRIDELRRAIESLDPEHYEQLGYYERWASALKIIAQEKNLFNASEFDQRVTEMESTWK